MINMVSLHGMFHTKNTKIGKTGRKNFGNSLAILFCIFVIASTIGNSFGTRNSFAQQLQTQQSPTIAYESPWNINLQMSSVNGSQPLCAAGVCNQSFYPATQPEDTASSTIPQTK